jgi:adenosylmethionine---8-amino-7-oxononanoate aminotransferase
VKAELEQADKQFVWHPFTQQESWEADAPIIIDRAQGAYLVDVDGNRYLDGVSSLWVNVHGHHRAEINAAITAQLDRVAHSTFLGLTHAPGIELARRLMDVVPGQLQRVFYSDTGAAAVEIALKMAFQYWQQRPDPRPRKTKFFSLHNAYHGDTIGALSVGGIDLFQQIYRPLLFPTVKAPEAYCYRCHLGKSYPSCRLACLDEIERAIAINAEELAAVIMEPLVQGAAGIIVYPPGYTRAVWEIAKRHSVLFIADEVATGFGRTGNMFACEHEGVEPDLMAVGKGISGGYLPLAATFATEEIYRAFLGRPEEAKTFYHGHTYTGNPVACAAALASLDLFGQERTLERLQPKIAALTAGLETIRDLPLVGDVRQRGFIAGIELVQDVATGTPFPVAEQLGVQVVKEARRHGVMLRPLSDVIVLMPPLAIADDELAALLRAVRESITAVAARYAARSLG